MMSTLILPVYKLFTLRRRNRTHNLLVKSRRLRPGVPLLSMDYRGLQCPKRSPFGARLDQILDQAAAVR